MNREPARLTYISTLDSGTYRRHTDDPIMAFDNEGYSSRGISINSDLILNACGGSRIGKAKSYPSLNQEPVTTVTVVELHSQDNISKTLKEQKLPSGTYESLLGCKIDESEGNCGVDGGDGTQMGLEVSAAYVNYAESPDWQRCEEVTENMYEELPTEYYENWDTLERQQHWHHSAQIGGADQTLPINYPDLCYENLPMMNDYTKPVNNQSGYSSRTFSTDTDFQLDEKELRDRANVTVISMSELSVDIRSCPDTPLFDRKPPGEMRRHMVNWRSSPESKESEQQSLPLSHSESQIHYNSEMCPREYFTSQIARRQRQLSSKEVLGLHGDPSWELKTHFWMLTRISGASMLRYLMLTGITVSAEGTPTSKR